MKINLWKLEDMPAAEKTRILNRAQADIDSVTSIVAPIIEDVRRRGDDALRDYARKFDGADIQGSLQATDEDFARAYDSLDQTVIDAIKTCAGNIRIHHQQQMDRVERQWLEEVRPGLYAGEKVTPIPSVGLYVPRGKGAFPSVMYMLCTPAVIAGVKTIAVCTPPTPDGGIDAASLIAADICGVRTVYKAGGAQAIAALAYGTETIPQVAQVSGPGNPYVASAKRLLSHVINPGMPAGPSESIVLADDSAEPWNTALDLVNEAEHGPDSASLLVTDSMALAEAVMSHLVSIVDALPEPRRGFCRTVFGNYGGIVVCRDMAMAIGFCNEYAVEHLLVKTRDADAVVAQIDNAGEILIGEATPMVLGNFGIGVNAVLPTGRQALTHSCTSVWSFLKRTSLSRVTPQGYRAIRDTVITMADYEGFPGHAEVLRQRREAAFASEA